MARTTPHTYYGAFVLPNFWDYQQIPDDVRRGFNACVAASQMTDILIAYYERENRSAISAWRKATVQLSIRELRIDLCRREPLFITVQSAATAYKHLHAKGAHYDLNTAGSLESVSVPLIGSIGINYREDERDVVVNRRDGSQVSLKAALDAVVNRMWPDILGSLPRPHRD